MASSLTGLRDYAYRYTLFTNQGAALGPLDGVTGGSLDHSVSAVLRSSADLNVVLTPKILGDRYVKIDYVLDPGKSTQTVYPLAKLLAATPVIEHGYNQQLSKVELYDRLIVLRDAKLTATLQLAKGKVATTALREQLALAGVTDASITPSAAVLSSDMHWNPGVTRLQVINDILGAMNYFSLYTDAEGQFHADPYAEPMKRPIAHSFVAGEFSIHSGDFSDELDYFGVPNVIVAIQRTDGSTAPLVAVARNDSPDSPFSTVARGREIVETREDVEATSAEALTGIAQRALNSSAIGRKLTIKHAWMPLKLNDHVYFNTDGVEGHYVINGMKVPLDGGLVTTSLLEVMS